MVKYEMGSQKVSHPPPDRLTEKDKGLSEQREIHHMSCLDEEIRVKK